MAAGAKSPSALAPFAHNWVGGDIHGLSAYAGTLYGYAPKINDVATALNSKVSQTVGGASWQGSAATAFSGAWDRDAQGCTALTTMTTATGDVVNWLAVNLSQLESALETAADKTAAHGVTIGPNGEPPQECLANATAESWRAAYQTFYNQAMHDAVNARNEAAGELQNIFNGVTGSSLKPGDRTSWNDVLLGFLGAKTRYRAWVEGEVESLKNLKNAAAAKAIADARQADGKFGKWSPEDRQAFDDAKTKFGAGEDQLAGAENAEGMFSKVMGFSANDIPAVSKALEDSSGLLKAGADLPFVDVAAAGAATYFNAQEDIADGIPAYAAYPSEAAGSALSLAGGYVAGDAATGVVAGVLTDGGALAGLGVGATGVGIVAGGAGVLAGGVVAYGVGDFVHNMIDENWAKDIHNDGVVGGVAVGTWHSVENTGKDLAHTASSIWHGVTSIF
jgi:uncharacterized protein YukE